MKSARRRHIFNTIVATGPLRCTGVHSATRRSTLGKLPFGGGLIDLPGLVEYHMETEKTYKNFLVLTEFVVNVSGHP